MYEEMMKYMNQQFQQVKWLVNIHKNNIDYAKRNVDKFETEMWNLEYEYALYRRKRVLIYIKHYVLMILTFGKRDCEDEIGDIEGDITENILKAYDLQKEINENDYILKLNEEFLNVVEQFYEKAEFLLSLTEEEKERYLGYKMGNSNINNKSTS